MRYLILLAVTVIDLILNNTVFPNINIVGISPDIIICTIASITILESSMTGAWIGLICGLFIDLYSGVFGFYALAYFLTGALAYFIRKRIFYVDKIIMPFAFAAGAYILKEAVLMLLAYMLDKQFSLSHMLLRYILPQAAFTAVFMLLVYLIFIRIYRLPPMKHKSAEDFKRLL